MAEREDMTGRRRLLRNSLVSWLSMLVLMAVGFVMPRVIDAEMGQAKLGVWDFCWSIVNYLSFINLGVSSGVNRYVATFRANGDRGALVQLVNTCYTIQIATALLGGAALATFAEHLSGGIVKGSGSGSDAERIVMILGASILFQLALAPARGVTNGCHRWDVTNIINVVSRLSSSVAMITLALTTGRLIDMAWAYLTVTLVVESCRYFWSVRILPESRFSPGRFSWPLARKLFHFGVYQNLLEIAPVLLLQAVNILVMGTLGAPALAILVRHVSLVKYIEMFINRFSRMLNPSTAALCAMEQRGELRRFFVDGTRYAAAMALPMLVCFGLFGETIVGWWMGDDYVHGDLVVILALGYCLPIVMGPAQSVLIGMYAHVRVTVMVIPTVVLGFITGYVLLDTIGWSLDRAAFMEVAILSLAFGVVIPVYCCRRLDLRFHTFVVRAFSGPLASSLLFLAGLVVTQNNAPEGGWGMWLAGLVMSLGALVVASWFWVLSPDSRSRILGRLRGGIARPDQGS